MNHQLLLLLAILAVTFSVVSGNFYDSTTTTPTTPYQSTTTPKPPAYQKFHQFLEDLAANPSNFLVLFLQLLQNFGVTVPNVVGGIFGRK